MKKVIATVAGLFGAAKKYTAVLAFLFLASISAFATDPTYPDPTTIYSNLSTPFNAALTWVIGAIGVLVVMGWILKAVRRK